MNNVSKMNTNITVYIIMSSTISSMVASNENQFKQQIKTTVMYHSYKQVASNTFEIVARQIVVG